MNAIGQSPHFVKDFPSSLYFDRTGKGRFDSPAQGYGILYVRADVYASWIECYGRTYVANGVSALVLKQRDLYAISCSRPLVFADLTGSSLVKMGADARLPSGAYTAAKSLGTASKGNCMTILVPCPAPALWARMLPPWSSTICRTIDNPKPKLGLLMLASP